MNKLLLFTHKGYYTQQHGYVYLFFCATFTKENPSLSQGKFCYFGTLIRFGSWLMPVISAISLYFARTVLIR